MEDKTIKVLQEVRKTAMAPLYFARRHWVITAVVAAALLTVIPIITSLKDTHMTHVGKAREALAPICKALRDQGAITGVVTLVVYAILALLCRRIEKSKEDRGVEESHEGVEESHELNFISQIEELALSSQDNRTLIFSHPLLCTDYALELPKGFTCSGAGPPAPSESEYQKEDFAFLDTAEILSVNIPRLEIVLRQATGQEYHIPIPSGLIIIAD